MAQLPQRGEVWLIDLGMLGKIRPVLVLSVPANQDTDRVLFTFVPHTTSTRASRFEVAINVRFLKEGAFDAQQLATIPCSKLIRKLGSLSEDQFALVEAAVRNWLGF